MTAPATAQPADVDPIDSLTFDDVTTSQVPDAPAIPEHMMLGGTPKDEVPEPTVEAPAAPEAKTDALPEGYKRDALGRVHGPDGKIVSADALAKLTTAPQQSDDSQSPKPTPFQYRANGETKPVEGYELHADGSVRVAPEKSGELRALLNARDMLGEQSEYVNQIKARNAALEQEVQQYKSGSAAEIQKANALTNTLTAILQDPDEAKAIEGFFTLRAQFPTLLAKAEAQYWQQQAKAGKPAQPQPQDQGQREAATPHGLPTREVATQVTTEHVERLKLENEFRDVTDWKQFDARVARTPLAYIVPATAEHAKQYGVRVGESVFDTDALLDDMKQYAASTKAAREVAASQAKLAAETARKTQASITAPPTPGGGGTPPRTGAKPFNSQQDVVDWWDSPEL